MQVQVATNRVVPPLHATPDVGFGFDDTEAALFAAGTVVNVPRGGELFHEGEEASSWYRVTSGALRTCKLMPDGRRQIESFLLPGDLLGMEAGAAYRAAAEAIVPTTVIRYSRRRIEHLADENPRLARRLFDIAVDHLCEAQARMILLGRKTAEERLASFVLEMLERSPETNAFDLPMSRHDIADYLALTIETVSRTFSAFKRDGLVALPNPQRVVVRDREGLRDICGD